MHWISIFGVPRKILSDNGSHFRNTLVRDLGRHLSMEHKYSTAYCAWSNGAIERVMRDLKALVKITLHENRMDKDDWPKIVRNIMFGVNQRPSRVLGGRTPVEVHFGMNPTNPKN